MESRSTGVRARLTASMSLLATLKAGSKPRGTIDRRWIWSARMHNRIESQTFLLDEMTAIAGYAVGEGELPRKECWRGPFSSCHTLGVGLPCTDHPRFWMIEHGSPSLDLKEQDQPGRACRHCCLQLRILTRYQLTQLLTSSPFLGGRNIGTIRLVPYLRG